MIDKLKPFKDRYLFLGEEVAKTEIISDNKTYKAYMKEYYNLEKIADAYDEMLKIKNDIDDATEMLKVETDVQLKEFLKEELYELNGKLIALNEQANILLLPKDENDESNVIIEVRPAAGGDEAALFANILMNMYRRYAERKRWEVEISDINETELGGIKEASFILKGKGAYSRLKFESGVHRVQRVPETESQGRVHTSTCTVAVLPEVEEVDFEIVDKDLKIDTYRASGAGGQHVNKTESAIRITHLPTGIVVACQDERSQIKNRDKAMRVLKAKLYDHYKEEKDKVYKENRKAQVGTGDRSERIRTYNYPQGRITDHRVNFSVFNVEDFTDGNLDEMIDELFKEDTRIKLENLL